MYPGEGHMNNALDDNVVSFTNHDVRETGHYLGSDRTFHCIEPGFFESFHVLEIFGTSRASLFAETHLQTQSDKSCITNGKFP